MKKSKSEVLKRAIFLSTFLGVCFPMIDNSAEVFGADNITVSVNGTQISFTDASPFIENGRTMVPLRGVFEAMGFSVNWDSDVWSKSSTELSAIYTSSNPELIGINTEINVVQGGDISVLKDNTIMQAGAKVETDADPAMVDGRYYLPLRVIAESTGATVDWNQESKRVDINFEVTPVKQDQTVVEDSLGVGYEGRWGDANTYDGKALEDQYGIIESINMDNYNHKTYYKNAPEGNGVVPTGAYYINTDNALIGPEVHSISLGSAKLTNGESIYIGEYKSSVEEKFGKEDSIDSDDGMHRYTDIGLNIWYTTSGRVQRFALTSNEANNFVNAGFSYGSGSIKLGDIVDTRNYEAYGVGEGPNSGSIHYDGIFFGTDVRISYHFNVNTTSRQVMSIGLTASSYGQSNAEPF